MRDKLAIRSPNFRVSAEFKKFLNNGDNKERLFEIIEQVWSENTHALENCIIFFARSNHCINMSQSQCRCNGCKPGIEMKPEPLNSVFVGRKHFEF